MIIILWKKKKKIENQMNERKIAIDYAKHDFFFSLSILCIFLVILKKDLILSDDYNLSY